MTQTSFAICCIWPPLALEKKYNMSKRLLIFEALSINPFAAQTESLLRPKSVKSSPTSPDFCATHYRVNSLVLTAKHSH